MRFEQRLTAEMHVAPADLLVAEAKIASPLRLENRNYLLLRRTRSSCRGCDHEVEKPEHAARRRSALVCERIRSAPRMVETSGCLEPRVVLSAAAEKAREEACGWKRLGGDAAGANLCAGVRGDDRRDE